MKQPVLYGIPNCDSVKKARAWLDERGIDYQFHDFKKSGLPPSRLDEWIAAAGWEQVLNRKGTTWRKLGDAERAMAEQDASAKALMLAQPSVIKRPVVQWPNGHITVGFDPAQWAAWLLDSKE